MANIYEKIILNELEKTHPNNKKQFGFKKNSSCGHALFVLRELLIKNQKNKKKTYICAIDASKAFDKVNRNFMWNKLIDKSNPIALSSLINYYENSVAMVNNNNEKSEVFSTKIGVKQGGPLSPKLFSIYMDELINEIEELKCGMDLYGHDIDILMYADDILLISNTRKNLQKMLKVTENYGKKYEIKFNPEKTTYMVFGENKIEKITSLGKPLENPVFDKQTIQRVNSMRYLGAIIDENLSNKAHLKQRNQSLMNKLSQINKMGFNEINLDTDIKTLIFKTYLRPILHYGLENLVLNATEKKKLQIIESTLIKRSVGLTKKAQTDTLLIAMNIEKFYDRLRLAKVSFMDRLNKNKYTSEICSNMCNVFNNHANKVPTKSIIEDFRQITNAGDYCIPNLKQKAVEMVKSITNKINEEKEKVKNIIFILKNKDREALIKELNKFKKLNNNNEINNNVNINV